MSEGRYRASVARTEEFLFLITKLSHLDGGGSASVALEQWAQHRRCYFLL